MSSPINPFGNPEELESMFGFVTDEDRARWASRPQPKEEGPWGRAFRESTENAERLGREARQASRHSGEMHRPLKKTTTTTTTEHIRYEEDYDY